MENVRKWFDSNRMVANPDKFQVMFLGLPKNCNISIELDDLVLAQKDDVKLPGINIYSDLKYTLIMSGPCV